MSIRTRPAATRPSLPLAVLVGLADGGDASLIGRIRAFQLQGGRQFALPFLGVNLLGVLAISYLFAHAAAIAPTPRLAWIGAVALAAVAVAVRRLAWRPGADNFATTADLRRATAEGALLALAWTVPPLLFASALTPSAALGVWTIYALVMCTAAVALATIPLSAAAFIFGIALAGAWRLYHAGNPFPAIATLLFAGLLVMAGVMRLRSLVAIRVGELALAERDETVSLLLREFEDKAADWLWETDTARRVVRASPRFAYALGLDPVKIDGMPFLQVLAGPQWESGTFSDGLRALSEKLKARESFRDLALPVTVNGEMRWWEIAASPRYDESGAFVGFRGVGSDVTEQRNAADKINRMARFDALTGLPNRLYVTETLSRAITEAERWGSRCAFMMIDLDRFKAVNDTLGHPIGDRLLGRVSERLGRLMTKTEIIGRLGGDEFAVVVRDASDPHRVEQLAHNIVETLSRPYEVDQHTLHIGASVGIAISPRDGRTAEMLVRSADLALYRSKEVGGGTVHIYEPQLHVQAEERRVLEMALRKALENGEMYLDYQPVVDAASEQLTGFEALLRWNHPELGLVPPYKFVPLAEEARLIGAIGEWVMRTACDEAARWPNGIRIAINVSPEQLHDPSFVATVTSALSHSGLNPHRLELEVTESVFMREGTGAVATLERVLDLGVRLSLDDFGTGYSSLGYLSRTRFSSIKIDRSFVQSASKGVREAVAIVRAVVALAKSLGMATTAEGVETEAELAVVRDLGCTKIQGYLFGRPLPVAEARALATRADQNSEAA